jgi:hypothetical protein
MIFQEGGRWRSEPSVSEQEAEVEAILDKLTNEERESLEALLAELKADGASEIADTCANLEWEEVPLPIDQWLDSYHHVGDTGETIYPVLKKDLIELFSGGYHEVILCLHPDTRVPLLDGTESTIRDLAERWKRDATPFWVYSYVDGELRPTKAIQPRQTGVDDYYRVTLDDGTTFTGNARHQMLRRNGEKVMIQDMRPGDSLMPFEVKLSEKGDLGEPIEGYEMLRRLDGEWCYTHRLVANLLCEKESGDEDTIHHEDFHKTNNTPENLRWMRWRDHMRLHSALLAEWKAANPARAADLEHRQAEHLRSLWEGSDGEVRRAEHAARLRERNLNGNASAAGKLAWINRSSEAKAAFSAMMVARNKSTKQRQAVSRAKRKKRGSKTRHSPVVRRQKVRKPRTKVMLRSDVTIDAITSCGASNINEAAERLECSATLIRRVLADAGFTQVSFFGNRRGKRRGKPDVTVKAIEQAIRDGACTAAAAAVKLKCAASTIHRCLKKHGLVWSDFCETVGNHYVVKVEKVGRGPVYCMTVPGAGNFAISTATGVQNSVEPGSLGGEEANPTQRSGVFSSNTGAI